MRTRPQLELASIQMLESRKAPNGYHWYGKQVARTRPLFSMAPKNSGMATIENWSRS